MMPSKVLSRVGATGLLWFVTISLLGYIAVATMVVSQLPPYGLVRDVLRPVEQPVAEEANQHDADYWISQIRQGENLFLHVRHTSRVSPSQDIQGFDYWELNNGGSSRANRNFVCLTHEGKAQAELLGWALREMRGTFFVVASPSCRAQETAEIALKSIDLVDTAHLYAGAIPESQRADFLVSQKRFFDNYEWGTSGTTTVIFGHEQLPYENAEWVIREDGSVPRKEGGVSVMSWDDTSEELTVHYSFPTVSDLVMKVFD